MHTQPQPHVQRDGTIEWPTEPVSTNEFAFVYGVRDGSVKIGGPDDSYIKSGPVLRALYRCTVMAQSPMNRIINYPTELAGQWIDASNEMLATLSCLIGIGAQLPTSGQIQRHAIEMEPGFGSTELYVDMMKMYIDAMAFAELGM